MKKRMVALFLAAMMLLSLVACSSQTEAENSAPAASAESTEPPKTAETEAPVGEVAEEKEPVTLTYYFMNGAGEQQYTTQVEEKLNEILDGIEGYEYISIDLVPCGQDYPTDFTLAQTSGAQIDLVSTYFLDMPTMVRNGDFLELSDLLAAYPNVTSEIPDWLVEMGKIFDGMYYVPTYQQAANLGFWILPVEYAEMYRTASGATKEDMAETIAHGTLEEKLQLLEDITLAVREGTGLDTKYIHSSTGVAYRYGNVEFIDKDYGMILLQEGAEAPVYWSYSEEANTLRKQMNEWYKEGLIHPDAATYKVADYERKNMMNEESLAIGFDQAALGAEALAARNSEAWGFEMEYYNNADHAYVPSKWAAGGNAIYADCEHPEEAMMIIELLMTKKGEEFYNTLVWGLEGIHWEWKDQEAKTITTLEYDGFQGDAADSYHAWKWNIGNTFNAWANQAVNVEDNNFILNEINNNPTTVPSPIAGITWDLSSIEDQIAQCTAVDSEYWSIYTMDNFEELNAEYMAKLEAAGVKDIIAEVTRQYNDYLASK